MDFFRGRNWDIIGKTKLWFTISAITLVVGVASLATRGLNLGIDFTGGTLLRYEFTSALASSDADVPQATAKVRQVLDELQLGSSEVQVVTGDDGRMDQLYLRTPKVEGGDEDTVAAQRSQQVMQGLNAAFPDKTPVVDLGRETVGPVVGEELRNNAILAFALGCALIMIYITIRYEFRFAIAAIIGLIHDVIFVMGCMSIFHVELNSAFVAAILTVLGYSNHDTVVIMDRIRENMRVKRQASFAATVNTSLLETLARSVNIVVTVLFTVVALLLFGGEAIRGFSLALLFGISTGCYSSICTAAPIVVLLEGRSARARAATVAAARGGRGTAQRPSTRAAASRLTENGETPAAESSGRAGRGAIERLQREELQQRVDQADAEQEAKREERRERRKREKERVAKKGAPNKKRF